MTEMNKQASETTKRLFAALCEEFLRNLEGFYPCDLNSGATLAEGNLTSKFAIVLRRDNQYGNALTWDEFSVPNECRTEEERRSKKPGNLDMAVIVHEQKEIVVVESKLLHFQPEKKSIGCNGLPLDFVRAINVIRSPEVFPKRIWDPEIQKKEIEKTDHSAHLSPLREKYDSYSTKMIGLCGIWTEKGAAGEETIGKYFYTSMEKQLKASFPLFAGLFAESELLVERLNVVFPVIQSKEWDYYLLMFVTKIEKGEIDYSAVPKAIDAFRPEKFEGGREIASQSRPSAPIDMQNIIEQALGHVRKWKIGNSTNYRYYEPKDGDQEVHVWVPFESLRMGDTGELVFCIVAGRSGGGIPVQPASPWKQTRDLDWGNYTNNWYCPIGGPESFNTEKGIQAVKEKIRRAIASLKDLGLLTRDAFSGGD